MKGDYITIKLSYDQLGEIIERFSKEKKAEVNQEVVISTLMIESGAKRDAPVAGKGKFGGFLRSHIYSVTKWLAGAIWSDVPYAPYQEFGTGSKVEVPAGWEDFAMQFKGKGIRQVNIKAIHYMFNAWAKECPIFIANVKRILGIS